MAIEPVQRNSGQMDTSNQRKNPLRTVIRYAVMIFLTLLIIYVLLNTAVAILQYLQSDPTYATKIPTVVIERVQHVSDRIETITGYVWEFFVPFLQLVLLFLVIDWLLTRLGIDVLSKSARLDWNIQTVIALIVISAFSIAALAGLQGAGSLKDVALVVVGFYFGSQRKYTEIQTDKGKVSMMEEHLKPAEPSETHDREEGGSLAETENREES